VTPLFLAPGGNQLDLVLDGTPKRVDYEPADESESTRLRHVILRAARKYPDNLLKNELDRILIFESFALDGINGSGTFGDRAVVMACSNSNAWYTSLWMEDTFHEEVAALLFTKYRAQFSIDAWKSLLPKELGYYKTSGDFIKDFPELVFQKKLDFEDGFYRYYSRSCVEKDFAIIASQLFLNRSPFWQAVDSSSRLQMKTNLVIAFLHGINGQFTKDYFEMLEPTKGRSPMGD
jgi:hypothetical protein